MSPRNLSKPEKVSPLLKPFVEFLELQSAGGIVLIVTTIIALVWANSPWAESYHHLWHTDLALSLGNFEMKYSLHHWINDGLMTIFFFVVGLEIKREVLVGELSSLKKSALPIAAAIGGMILPALIFISFNLGKTSNSGWGIPMATDIAFAIGILTLLGDRVPTSLKVFLTALAIIDDLGAVLVIAFFYTSNLSWTYLGAGVLILLLLFIANRMDIRQPFVYVIFGLGLWYCFLMSGVHATIAGVLLALMVPARKRIRGQEYLEKANKILTHMENGGLQNPMALATPTQLAVIHSMKQISSDLETPLQRMEHALHGWTTFVIIPVFALANAGVHLSFDMGAVTHSVTVGVLLGLILGKQLGVTLFAWLVVKLGWADRPEGVTWKHIYGVGWLAGIGFTMSLFITNLAYKDETYLLMSKFGILGASLIAGIVGFIILKKTLDQPA